MRNRLVAFLDALGIGGVSGDLLLDYAIACAARTVEIETNRHISRELETPAVYIAAGHYLSMKKASGGAAGLDIDAAIKQIQEGDTSVTFAVGAGSYTPEQRLDRLIEWFLSTGRALLAGERRLAW